MQNVSAVLQPVRDLDQLDLMPPSKMDQLRAQPISEQEKKNLIATYYVQTFPWASWEHLADLLYQHSAVEAVRNYWQAPRGTIVMVTE